MRGTLAKRGTHLHSVNVNYLHIDSAKDTCLVPRDSVKIMEFYGPKTINNFPTTSQKNKLYPQTLFENK